MPNNSAKRPYLKITPELRKEYERSIRAFDQNPKADPDARPLPLERWANAMTRPEFEAMLAAKHRTTKKQTTVRLDADVLDWLKSKGGGHISRVNEILRSVMLAERKRSTR
jgi:uncharacterized protein (DUF4415 family)